MWLKTQNLTSSELKIMLNEQTCGLTPYFNKFRTEDAAKITNKRQILYFIGFCAQMWLKTQNLTSFELKMMLKE